MSIATEPVRSSVESAQHSRVAQTRNVLRNRHFLLLWLAQLISQTILNAANFGLVALVSGRADGALMAILAVIALNLPAVPFSMVAGVVVDRMNKRFVLWVTNLLRVAVMLLMAGWLISDQSTVWPLFALMFLAAFIGQFFIPAEGAAIPLLVGESDLLPALSLFHVTITLAQAIGFLVFGRIVIALFPTFTVFKLTIAPTAMLFIIIAICYAFCALLILLIPRHAFQEKHLQTSQKERSLSLKEALQSLWRDMMEGWTIVRRDRLLFFAVVQLSVVGIITQLIGALAGIFVKVILARPAQDMSIILAPAAVGMIGMSLLIPHFIQRISKIRLALLGLTALAIGFLMLPTVHWIALHLDPLHGTSSPILFWIIVVLVFCLGVAMTAVGLPTGTIMQEQAPEEGRARVISLQFMLYSAGTIPVLLFAGIIAQYFGFSQTVLMISASILLFCIWGNWYLRREQAARKS